MGNGSGNYFYPIKREFLNLSGGTVTGDTIFTANFSAETIYSGGTNLYDVIHSNVTAATSSLTSVAVQNGLNTYTGGTASLPTVNVSALTIDNLIVTGNSTFNTLSATTYFNLPSTSGFVPYTGATQSVNLYPFNLIASGASFNGRVSQIISGNSTFFGFNAGLNDNLGASNFNTVFGWNALPSNINGVVNVAIGYQALSAFTGNSAVAVGYNAGRDATNGGNSVFIGESAGRAGGGGVGGNVYLGKAAGLFHTGQGSIFIGFDAGRYSVAENNVFYLNNRDLVNTAQDKTASMMYGVFSTTLASQTLTINAAVTNFVSTTTPQINGVSGATGLTIVTNNTASGALARGVNFAPTLVASANNDILVGLDVNPTFTNGAFTGVANYAAKFHNGNVNIISGSNNVIIGSYSTSTSAIVLGQTGLTSTNWNIKSDGTSLDLNGVAGYPINFYNGGTINFYSYSNAITFGGTATGGQQNKSINMERNQLAAGTGSQLTISAGGVTPATADKNGGDLLLSSGIATGTGSSKIHFYTSTASGSTGTTDNVVTEKMTILGNGNVGIGTTNPALALDVNGGIFSNQNSQLAMGTGKLLYVGNGIYMGLDGGTTFNTVSYNNDYNYSIQTRTGNVYYNRLYIKGTNGNVGIGTISPAYLLDVTGTTRTTALTATSISATTILGRIQQRITTITSSATPTINTDNCDAVTITALATNITSFTTNLTGTPNDFDKLIFRIKDDGTARTLAFGAKFRFSADAGAPTTTVLGKVMYIGFIYNSVDSVWDNVSPFITNF